MKFTLEFGHGGRRLDGATEIGAVQHRLDRVDRTMALKLFSGAGDKRYPAHADLMRFGREVCHTQRPDVVLDRIATAMGEALRENRGRFTTEHAQLLEAEWETGIAMIPAVRPASQRTPKGLGM